MEMKLSTLVTELRKLQTRMQSDGKADPVIGIQVDGGRHIVSVERIYSVALIADWDGKTRVVFVPMRPLVQLPGPEEEEINNGQTK